MENNGYLRGFAPYAAAALLVGTVGGFAALLGPAFVRDLNLNPNNTAWTALAGAMSAAACAPVLGKLADVLGRRLLLLLGLGIYTLGNVLTAMAPSLFAMLIARFVVGVGTAAVAPVVISYILTEFPPHKRAWGFSAYMLLSSASVVIGPTAGAWILQVWGWRAMMWLCTGLCVLVLVYCIARGEPVRLQLQALSGFDGAGALMILVFFSLVLCVPAVGQNIGWDSTAFRLVFLGTAGALFGLIQAEKRAQTPILPLAFMKRKTFVLSVAALFLTQGLLQANMTNTIVFVNHAQPENNVVSGYAISVMYIGMALGAAVLGPLADRYAPKPVLTGSLLLTALGAGIMLLFTEAASAQLLMLSLGTLGFGLGGNGTIFLKVVLTGLSREEAGAGTGTYGLFRDLAAPFGVAVLVPFYTNGIANGVGRGLGDAAAAVEAIRLLAMVELVCILLGIAAVRLLPRDRKQG